MFSDKDPVTKGIVKFFREDLANNDPQKNILIENAGHFLQEDQPKKITDWIIQKCQMAAK